MATKQYLDETGLIQLVEYISNNYISAIKITLEGSLKTTQLTSSNIEEIRRAFEVGKPIIIKDASGYIIPTAQKTDSGKIVLTFLYNGLVEKIEF